jgi:hypothetical protein
VAATLLYIIGLAAAAQMIPNAGEPVLLAALILFTSVTRLLQVFTLGPADLGVKASGYPAHMLVLPMTARSLTGWPMLFAATTFVSLWVLVAYAVWMPAGFSPAIVWPAALIAAATTWMQAISWAPFPTPFARVPALVVTLLPLVLLGLWGGRYFESHTVAVSVIGAGVLWTAAAYRFAVHGLSRARCGVESRWSILPESIRRTLARRRVTSRDARRPFGTATAAQLWHECRRNVVFLPAMMAFIGIPMLALNCLSVLNPKADRTMLFGGFAITPAAMSVLIWLCVPLLLTTTAGQGLGKFDLWGKDTLPSFFAIRPMTTTRFVMIKLLAAAVSVLACWAIVWLLLILWALLEVSPLNANESLVRSVLANLTPRGIALAIAAMLGLVAVAWRAIVIGMWPSLAGRKAVSTVIAIASWVALTTAVVVGSWIYRHPEVHPRLMAALPWLLAGLVTMKLCGVVGSVTALRRLRVVAPRTLTTVLLSWGILAAAALAGISHYVPLTWQIAGGVLLFLPLVRVSVAPLALHVNRHR